MCKYCNTHEKIKTFLVNGEPADTHIEVTPSLEWALVGGTISMDFEFPITYCPICGEKLIVDSE